MKLVQKQFTKGTREFEISDDAVYVRIKGFLKNEKLAISFSMLDPEPVVNGVELEFYGKDRREPLLSLIVNNPDAESFGSFVNTLKRRIKGEDDDIHVEDGRVDEMQHQAPGWNVYDEPPEFDTINDKNDFQPVNSERLADDITMLKTYLDQDEIGPLLEALEILKTEPESEAAYQKMLDAYNGLGTTQGAVLTYASYLKILLSNNFW